MVEDIFDDEELLDPNLGQETSSKTRIDQIKQQRWRNNMKYTDAIPAIQAKPNGIYRFYPDVELDTGELRPYVENGRITWAIAERGVDFFGLKIPEAGIKNSFSFWILPVNMDQYFPELDDMSDPKERRKFELSHSPYSYLQRAIDNSASDPDAPDEWAVLGRSDSWKELVHDRNAYPPFSLVKVHAVVRGCIYANKSVRYDDETYEDDRSDGSLHPAVMEFGPSATWSLLGKDGPFREQKSRASGDSESDLYKLAYITDPDRGQSVTLVARRIRGTGKDRSEYNVHEFVVKESFDWPVSVEEVIAEWHPYREEAELNGQLREPILSYMECEKHVAVILKAFDRELADYAFRDTPYWDVLPAYAKGSYDKYISQYRAARAGHWLEYVGDRARSGENQYEADLEPPQAPRPTAKRVDEILARAASENEDRPGTYDPESAEEYRKDLEALGDDEEE